MNSRYTLLILVSIIFVYSCSSTETVVETEVSNNGIFPSWYSSSSFLEDSTSFSGLGLAIAADSSVAVQRATDDAKKNLDLAIGKLSEDVRTELVRKGVTSAGNTDFILILRNAHADAVSRSELIDHKVLKEENKFRVFAKVDIDKALLVEFFEFGFTGHPRYWAAFSDNPTFESVFE